MAASATLLIYLNSDVGMERPYRTTLPVSVDTLAELCQFLTSRIPPRLGEDGVGRGYRFLYTVHGKPLWRVKECVDAGTIVLSVGPGFLARRPAAITEYAPINAFPAAAAAAVGATTNLVDLTTPDRLAATSRSGANVKGNSSEDNHGNHNSFLLSASPSASPPIKAPAEHRFYSAPPAVPPRTAAAYADVYGTGVVGEHELESIDAAWPPAPSVRCSSQADERDRLVSITLNTAARSAQPAFGGPITQSTPLTHAAAEGADGAGGRTPAVRLFTPPGALAATRGSGGGPQRNSTLFHQPPLPPGPALRSSRDATAEMETSAAAPSGSVPRGVVLLAHATYELPPKPRFPPAATALRAVLPHLQPLASTSISSNLHYLLVRKWDAYRKLNAMPPADLIAGEALSQEFNSITAACSSSSSGGGGGGGGRAYRVAVSGPPRSGVSTTAALLVRHLLRTLQFQLQHRLHNTLLIALDFTLLFGPQVTRASALQRHAPPRVLLDLASLYQLVVRSVMDAVVAQRPSLREAGPLLSQLWDLLVKPNVEPKEAPNFTTYTQAAALVGGDVLARWTRLGEQMFPILQAACRTPEVPELRDAALDLIFYATPAEVAASLNFSGVFYVVDGAEALTRCYAERVARPAGDLGPLLRALTTDPRTHMVLAWPATIPSRSLFVAGLTAHISTISLVTRAALNNVHVPQRIRCGRKDYAVETFLGCPGYLKHLYAVVRPFRKNLTVPTTAYSTHYQQHYERSPTDGYAVRIDSDEVSHALDALLALVEPLPAA